MHRRDDHEPIAEAIAQLTAAGPAPARALAIRLAAAAGQDHGVPAAREWLARWFPTRGFVLDPACSCAAGRCVACN